MRDFVIVSKDDATKKATLRVDMVEDKVEKLTIMWCDGVRDTEFEKIIPWKCGTVTSMTEAEEWAANTSPSTMYICTEGSKLRSWERKLSNLL